MKSRDSKKFIDELLSEVPELRAKYDEHIADYEEMLPHVFFGEVTVFVIRAAGDRWRSDMLIRLLKKLESGMAGGSEEVKNLVAVSFVEGLCGETEALAVLKPLMGEKLRAQLTAMCGE